jgi:hypothetical protein
MGTEGVQEKSALRLGQCTFTLRLLNRFTARAGGLSEQRVAFGRRLH